MFDNKIINGLKSALPFVIFICIFGYVMSEFLTLIPNSFIYKEVINGTTLYRYDGMSYIRNISDVLSNPKAFSNVIIPNLQWNGFVDAIKSITNILIMPINLLLVAVRLAAYILIGFFAILGVSANSEWWVMQLLQNIQQFTVIPYVEY